MTISIIEECLKIFSETLDVSKTEDSEFGLFFHDYENDGSFCGTIYKCNELNSQLDFSYINPGKIHIEQIRVNEEKQHQGTGSMFFELLLQIVKCLDSSDMLLENEKIRIIDGDLNPYEYPLDQYDKSIPFYRKMAEKYGLGFTLYERDNLRRLSVVPESSHFELISRAPEGAFEFKLS